MAAEVLLRQIAKKIAVRTRDEGRLPAAIRTSLLEHVSNVPSVSETKIASVKAVFQGMDTVPIEKTVVNFEYPDTDALAHSLKTVCNPVPRVLL